MTLAFLGLGAMEIVIILIVLFLIIAVANYGRDTALGYWGTLILSLITSPVVGFIVVLILKNSKPKG